MTEEQFHALLSLIDAKITYALKSHDNPNDAPRLKAAKNDLVDELDRLADILIDDKR